MAVVSRKKLRLNLHPRLSYCYISTIKEKPSYSEFFKTRYLEKFINSLLEAKIKII